MQAEDEFSVLVIRSDNTRAHLFREIDQVMLSSPIGANDEPGGVEFFSTAGQRLAPVFGKGWQLAHLVPTAEGVQPQYLLDRLRTTIEAMKDYLRDNPDLLEKEGLSLEDGLRRLPELAGVPLETALEIWSEVLGHAMGSHTADPWHNFWVHGIL